MLVAYRFHTITTHGTDALHLYGADRVVGEARQELEAVQRIRAKLLRDFQKGDVFKVR